MLYFALGTTIALGLLVVGNATTNANHPYAENLHVGTIHRNDADSNEGACTDSHTDLDEVYVRIRINNTLQFDEPSLDWQDSIEDDKIKIAMNTTPCETLFQEGRLGQIELRYRVYNNGFPESNDCARFQATNCTLVLGAYWNSAQSHDDYYFAKTLFSRSWIYDSDGTQADRSHIVSHETGHAFGLADRPPCGTVVGVMHPRYYCADLPTTLYPTDADKNSVNFIAR